MSTLRFFSRNKAKITRMFLACEGIPMPGLGWRSLMGMQKLVKKEGKLVTFFNKRGHVAWLPIKGMFSDWFLHGNTYY